MSGQTDLVRQCYSFALIENLKLICAVPVMIDRHIAIRMVRECYLQHPTASTTGNQHMISCYISPSHTVFLDLCLFPPPLTFIRKGCRGMDGKMSLLDYA